MSVFHHFSKKSYWEEYYKSKDSKDYEWFL